MLLYSRSGCFSERDVTSTRRKRIERILRVRSILTRLF